jgi:hypothetical protein
MLMIKKIVIYIFLSLMIISCSSKNGSKSSDSNRSLDINETNETTKKNDSFADDMKEFQKDMGDYYMNYNKDFFPEGF